MYRVKEFFRVYWKHLVVMALLGASVIYGKQVGYQAGYQDASEEVAITTQRLLMENCLSFNADLARMGKPERMDCSLFSDLNPSTMAS